MKKVILLVSIIILLTGCMEVSGEYEPSTYHYNTTKLLTKQICDWSGWDSERIIREQAQQGYTFTGKTSGFVCDNLLNFQLNESKNVE